MKWPDFYDSLALAGFCALVYGLYLVNLPLALIAGGTILLAFAVFGAYTKGKP